MDRVPLFYTFGNHMHWVDMEWLWGYHVLPGSVRDMLRLCREAGAKANVNFDGIGYEKLASEDPEAFAELRAAVRDGTVEVVGASYGQPYGQFHGGESNVRQRVYGVRTALRLFGVRPQTFWEEEFDFFPQLPQMLARAGFKHASLFFQWTWHTPELPVEDVPVVRWEAPDGSGLLAATRNRLNLHQWPEDMDLTFRELAENPPAGAPLVLQWLELMPSPDWMCRSEVILPKLKELLSDPRFEVKATTLSGYLEGVQGPVPTRSYHPDQTWHGLSLGKNGDRMRRLSYDTEGLLLKAEALSATLGLFGRPYAQWDVYPTWELEEAWRELLQAQHHDNDECEGLCGRVGVVSYERATSLAEAVYDLTQERLSQRMAQASGIYLYNPLPWERTVAIGRLGGVDLKVPETAVPGYGWTFAGDWRTKGMPSWQLPAGVTRQISQITSWTDETWGTLLDEPFPVARLRWNGEAVEIAPAAEVETEAMAEDESEVASDLDRPTWTAQWMPNPEGPGLELEVQSTNLLPAAEPGFGGAWRMAVPFDPVRVYADAPYSVYEVGEGSRGKRKYPEGDWMTSPQWFEDVEGAFTALSFVDLVREDGSGLLVCHDGSPQWFRRPDGRVEVVLGLVDPWDETAATDEFRARFRLIPHGPWSNADRWRRAQEFRNPVELHACVGQDGDIPMTFEPFKVRGGLTATAFYRETEDFSGRGLEEYAGTGMGYPYVVRLVEWDGQAGEAEVAFAATPVRAVKTNLMGEVETELPIDGSAVRVPYGPYEIVTLYLDLAEGRKQTRDLDAKREIWATVHRTEG